MPPELPDESDIFCGDTNDKNIYADGCDPEKELTMLHGGAARETAPARRNVPVRGRGQRRSYGYYDSEGFSREAYNAAYMDSNSEAEFVISSEAPTAEASLYMRRERVPVQGHGIMITDTSLRRKFREFADIYTLRRAENGFR